MIFLYCWNKSWMPTQKNASNLSIRKFLWWISRCQQDTNTQWLRCQMPTKRNANSRYEDESATFTANFSLNFILCFFSVVFFIYSFFFSIFSFLSCLFMFFFIIIPFLRVDCISYSFFFLSCDLSFHSYFFLYLIFLSSLLCIFIFFYLIYVSVPLFLFLFLLWFIFTISSEFRLLFYHPFPIRLHSCYKKNKIKSHDMWINKQMKHKDI